MGIMLKSSIAYEPALDGLRAVAILAVLVYHLESRWLPGGFSGVDVFFVLSGFLITRIMLADIEAGSFQLSRYYQKRIARIIPASLLVATVTLVVAVALYDAQERESSGSNYIAALLSIVNIKQMRQENYFLASPDANPFLHYWSLSLEEQFYFIFPISLQFASRYPPRGVMFALFVLAAASLVACVILTPIDQQWAFYLLPSRGWELLSGAMIAHQLHRGVVGCSAPWASVLRWGGVIGLLVSFVAIGESGDFPGIIALVPVLSTVALIAGLLAGPSWIGQRLSGRLPVAIGRLSYSLYLWHWPVFSFVDYATPFSSLGLRTSVKIVVTIALSLVSFFTVETPMRRTLAAPGNRRSAWLLVVVPLVLFLPFANFLRTDGYPRAYLYQIASGGRVFNRSADRRRAVLYGDSMAAVYAKVFREACEEAGYECHIMAVPAALPVPTSDGRDRFFTDAMRGVAATKPDVIFIAFAYGTYVPGRPQVVHEVVEAFRPLTRRLVLLTNPPDLPSEATREAIRAGSRPPFLEAPGSKSRRHLVDSIVNAEAGPAVRVINAGAEFVLQDGSVRALDAYGRSLYHDRTHLGYRGASLLKSAISGQLDESAGGGVIQVSPP
ncbi:MAG: hypothetical protein RLZZ326_979 [Planctomycetota bacterium]|jgi:peptidoglycan/LPS O-acetylase OafA/YrhL